jgi:hypothetical protein
MVIVTTSIITIVEANPGRGGAGGMMVTIAIAEAPS